MLTWRSNVRRPRTDARPWIAETSARSSLRTCRQSRGADVRTMNRFATAVVSSSFSDPDRGLVDDRETLEAFAVIETSVVPGLLEHGGPIGRSGRRGGEPAQATHAAITEVLRPQPLLPPSGAGCDHERKNGCHRAHRNVSLKQGSVRLSGRRTSGSGPRVGDSAGPPAGAGIGWPRGPGPRPRLPSPGPPRQVALQAAAARRDRSRRASKSRLRRCNSNDPLAQAASTW